MANVLITGGTGLIGRHLVPFLRGRGHQVGVLSRSGRPVAGARMFSWQPEQDRLNEEAVRWAEAVVHLAGANIGEGRWTERRKQEIFDSRVRSAELLYRAAEQAGARLKVFVSASATGYYGQVTRDRAFRETDPPGRDFLAGVCTAWEQAADQFSELGARVVKLRTGVVLAADGGALPRFAGPARWGLAPVLGSGRQFLPWIHILDLVRLYALALEKDSLKGPYNAVAPQQVRQRDFVRTLAAVLGRPRLAPPVPAVFLRLFLGEMAGMLLEGSPVSAEKLLATGFTFRFPELGGALEDLLSGEE